MKIKQKVNIGILVYTAVVACLYVFTLVKGAIKTPHELYLFLTKGLLFNVIVIFIIVALIISSFYGTVIEVKNGMLIRVESYLKKKFLIEKVKRIYCAQHLFLGPTIFIEYDDKPKFLFGGFEYKLTVLNQYRDEDEKRLLDFLADKYPEINQDENCKKIRNGEKVFVQPRGEIK